MACIKAARPARRAGPLQLGLALRSGSLALHSCRQGQTGRLLQSRDFSPLRSELSPLRCNGAVGTGCFGSNACSPGGLSCCSPDPTCCQRYAGEAKHHAPSCL